MRVRFSLPAPIHWQRATLRAIELVENSENKNRLGIRLQFIVTIPDDDSASTFPNQGIRMPCN